MNRALVKEPPIYPSHRRKPVSSVLNFIYSGMAVTPVGGNPGRNECLLFNQRFLKYLTGLGLLLCLASAHGFDLGQELKKA
ncbi:MAG: hypothetical protein Q8J61_02245, partial [Sulfuricella sp.]|nr:hypothetical protein [Sulfuricella sp.]